MNKDITIKLYDATGNELAPHTEALIHPQLLEIDHSRTRFFRADGTELLFATEQAINAQFENVFKWAETLGLSGRVAFTMFAKYAWMPKYKTKPKAITAMHQRIIEAAHTCGFTAQLKIDGWL